jgi:hypothetical protein
MVLLHARIALQHWEKKERKDSFNYNKSTLVE